MGLEVGNFVEDLNVANPPGGDSKSQGDDHLRLIKNVLRNTFKRATKAFSFPGTISKSANYSVQSADDGLTVLCDATAGDFTLTLPTLASGDAGWAIFVIKSSSDANAIFLQPTSGTISGLAKVRRSIDNGMTRVTWTGGAYHATRPNGGVIGSTIPFHGSVLPNGHLWADGAAINAATHPELSAVLGANKPDLRGRAPFGRDDMGGSPASRISVANAAITGIAGATLGAGGGEEVHTLQTAELASHSHPVTGTHSHGTGTLVNDTAAAHAHSVYIRDPTHSHSGPSGTTGLMAGRASGGQTFSSTAGLNFSLDGSSSDATNVRTNSDSSGTRTNATDDATAAAGGHSHTISGSTGAISSGTTDTNGSSTAHQNMPPALICNYIVVAE